MTMPFIDYKLTERERRLVWAANQDELYKGDGVFRIDTDTFQCDRCDSRLPHNGKYGKLSLTDVYITNDEGTLCRFCAAECPDLMERIPDPGPLDAAPGRGND